MACFRWIATGLLVMGGATAWAGAPDLRTPAPVIYLADNLDEADQLGWCIDTVGRGFAETLHAHSCKPRGGDVQFALEPETGRIVSVAFENRCVTWTPGQSTAFGLLACSDDSAQQFQYDAETQSIHPAGQTHLCMAVTGESRSAGPFMSQDLVLADCAAVEPELRMWVVKP